MKLKIGFSVPINNPFPILSWTIRAIYNTSYSHTYFKFHSVSIQRDLVYEAVGVGVRFIGSKRWSEHAKTVKEFEIEVTPEQYTRFMQKCVDHAGVKYAKTQLIGIYIAKLFRMKHNIFKNGESQEVCSEIVGRLMCELGYQFDKDLDLLTPKDIYKALDK